MSDTDFAAVCSVDGCDRPYLARGYCRRHYSRWYRHRDVSEPLRIPGECGDWLRENSNYEGDGACLIWPYARLKTGYGVVYFEGRQQLAGRAMCILVHGAPPTLTHEAAHTCGKGHEGCVHPRHLYWATPTQNQADRIKHGTDIRGERASWAKLTEPQVIEIRRLAQHLRHKDVAALFGISRSMVGLIVRRKEWAHV